MTDPFEYLVTEAAEADLKPDQGTIERTLLAGLFRSPEAAARILAATRPTDFYHRNARSLAEAVYSPLSQGEHVDRVTIRAGLGEAKDDREREEQNHLLDLAEEVFALVAVDPPPLGKVEAYLGIFVEDARRRLAKSLVEKTGKALDARERSPQEAAADVFKIVAELDASRRLVGASRSEGDEWSPYFAALEASQDPGREGDFTGLDAGFDHFNRVVNGLGPGLYVLGAAPGTGKTTWAKQVADHVVATHPTAAVLFVSLEQSKEELRLKTLSRLSGVENRDIRRGRQDVTSPAWAKVRKAAEDYHAASAGRFFILEGDRMTTPDRIRLAALQVRQATQVADLLVVVDYLQIVPTEAEFRDLRNRVDFVVSELRRLARDLHCPVLAVSSVSRASYDASRQDAFKESGGIEYTADVGLIMVKDKDKAKGSTPIDGVMRDWERVFVDVVKNRNGERSRIAFDYFKAIDRFVEGDKLTLPEE